MTSTSARTVTALAAAALALVASGALARHGIWRAVSEPGQLGSDRRDTPLIYLPSAPPITAPPDDCPTRLARAGAEAIPVAAPPADPALPCGITEPVTLIAVTVAGSPGQRILFPSRPLISCAMAERMARFSSDIAAPLALGIFRQPLHAIETGSGYECRPRNRQPGGKMSSHGQGNALDLAAFLLADRRQIAVAKPSGEDGQRFIWALRMAGCGAFSTVLGPGSDAFHADHLHFDIEARGRDGTSKFCQ